MKKKISLDVSITRKKTTIIKGIFPYKDPGVIDECKAETTETNNNQAKHKTSKKSLLIQPVTLKTNDI